MMITGLVPFLARRGAGVTGSEGLILLLRADQRQ